MNRKTDEIKANELSDDELGNVVGGIAVTTVIASARETQTHNFREPENNGGETSPLPMSGGTKIEPPSNGDPFLK